MEVKKKPTVDDLVRSIKETKHIVVKLQEYELAGYARDLENRIYDKFGLPKDYKVGEEPRIFCEIATKEDKNAKIWHLSTVLWPKESLPNLEFYAFKVLREFDMAENIHEQA